MTTTDIFLKELKKHCKDNNVTLKFVKGTSVHISGDIFSSGYFDSANLELAVARDREDWLAVLVHESCHLDQMLEKVDIWEKECEFGNTIVDKWLMNKPVKNVRKSFNRVISLEYDCEKRALDKIVKYDLPINVITYSQRANAYLLFHNYAYEIKGWFDPERAPYTIPEVFSKMPKKLMSESYYKKLTPRHRKIFQDAGL